MTAEKTKTPGGVRRFLNYRKTIWDWLTDKALDTEASHSLAHSNLRLFPESDSEMDRCQDELDNRLIRAIQAIEGDHLEEAIQFLRQAQALRVQIELWEAMGERSGRPTGPCSGPVTPTRNCTGRPRLSAWLQQTPSGTGVGDGRAHTGSVASPHRRV